MSKISKLLLATSVILIICCACSFVWNEYRAQRNFDRVLIGASRTDVVRLLGKPWKVDKCGERFGNPNQPGCADEYLYKHPFAPLVPEYHSVSFDFSGHVKDTYIYSSP